MYSFGRTDGSTDGKTDVPVYGRIAYQRSPKNERNEFSAFSCWYLVIRYRFLKFTDIGSRFVADRYDRVQCFVRLSVVCLSVCLSVTYLWLNGTSYFEDLLNVENPRDPLEQVEAVEGPEDEISYTEIEKAVKQMRNNKAPGPSGITAEMIKALDEVGVDWLHTILYNF